MLLFIDNGSYFSLQVEKYLKGHGIDYITHRYHSIKPLPPADMISGVVISGSEMTAHRKPETESSFSAIEKYKTKPILGLCLGNQIAALALGGKIRKLPKFHDAIEPYTLVRNDPIFDGMDTKKMRFKEAHQWVVSDLPGSFHLLASSKTCHVGIIKHKRRKLYGIQSHPEATRNKNAEIFLDNFMRMCGEIK